MNVAKIKGINYSSFSTWFGNLTELFFFSVEERFEILKIFLLDGEPLQVPIKPVRNSRTVSILSPRFILWQAQEHIATQSSHSVHLFSPTGSTNVFRFVYQFFSHLCTRWTISAQGVVKRRSGKPSAVFGEFKADIHRRKYSKRRTGEPGTIAGENEQLNFIRRWPSSYHKDYFCKCEGEQFDGNLPTLNILHAVWRRKLGLRTVRYIIVHYFGPCIRVWYSRFLCKHERHREGRTKEARYAGVPSYFLWDRKLSQAFAWRAWVPKHKGTGNEDFPVSNCCIYFRNEQEAKKGRLLQVTFSAATIVK